MKTFFGILIGVVVTLSILMALTVWNAHKKVNDVTSYIAVGIQKGVFPTRESLDKFQPPAPAEKK